MTATQTAATPAAAPWLRTRFQADPDDWRPITWPPPGPCWCTGYGDGYSVVVAYHPADTDVRAWWPEATELDPQDAPDGPVFTDRFPRPDWWKDPQ